VDFLGIISGKSASTTKYLKAKKGGTEMESQEQAVVISGLSEKTMGLLNQIRDNEGDPTDNAHWLITIVAANKTQASEILAYVTSK
jgi:hypothetical protein